MCARPTAQAINMPILSLHRTPRFVHEFPSKNSSLFGNELSASKPNVWYNPKSGEKKYRESTHSNDADEGVNTMSCHQIQVDRGGT